MPDFVYSTATSAFSNKFRDLVLPYERMFTILSTKENEPANNLIVDKLKEFDIDMSKGALKNADLIPPPSFSHETVPFNWMYVPTI